MEKEKEMRVILKELKKTKEYIGYIVVDYNTRIYADVQKDFPTLAQNLINKYHELQYLQREQI
jgi:hypothetical protein